MWTIEIEGIEEKKKDLAELSNALAGKGALRCVWRDVGIAGIPIWNHIFDEQGRRFGDWEATHFLTKLLRARGSTRKYRTIEDVINAPGHTLVDTQIGRMSFGVNAADGVFRPGGNQAVFGSRLGYMMAHDTEGSVVTFTFGKEQQSRFKKNFAKKINGKHNPEYYKLWNWLKKLSGQSFSLPYRQISPEGEQDILDSEMKNMLNAFEWGLQHYIDRIGL